MGALVSHDQRQDVQDKVNALIQAGCEVLLGGKADLNAAGAFFPPTLLFCPRRMKRRRCMPSKPSARLPP